MKTSVIGFPRVGTLRELKFLNIGILTTKSEFFILFLETPVSSPPIIIAKFISV